MNCYVNSYFQDLVRHLQKHQHGHSALRKDGRFCRTVRKEKRSLIFIFPNYSGVDKLRNLFFSSKHLESVIMNSKVTLLFNWLVELQDSYKQVSCLHGLKIHYCISFIKLQEFFNLLV